ncbi:hypothetical protein D1AOALGA4SA_1159 [Olavius algarvensis Delta 1 endosymbiont]|nr:hypothetical protein D1AOALGA4SA_1159 [Olavius algarvensis Delta 1 endosymbiont]
MIKFYTNKELSQIFSINLAKWKRWSREFLPPDPLGGLQSGFARQYNLDEAFSVYLGGQLVGNLKLTIPEARRVLHDLHQWLVDHDFYFDFSGTADPAKKSAHPIQNYQIAIISPQSSTDGELGLRYWIKAVMTSDSIRYQGVPMQQERFVESAISSTHNESAPMNAASYRMLNISFLRQTFLGYFDSE